MRVNRILAITALSSCPPSPALAAATTAMASRRSTPPTVSSSNPGFTVPTTTTKANMKVGGAWTEIGDADWTCLNTASPDQPSTQAIALSGKIEDFQTGNGVGAATVTVFPGIELGGNLGTTTSSNVAATRGDYTMNLGMLPSGTTRYGFKFEADSYVKTYLLNQYVDPTMATQTRNMDAVSDVDRHGAAGLHRRHP